MEKYNHKKIESKWQKRWQDAHLYSVSNTVTDKKNFYALVEFPYPSGNLHVGHWYSATVPDIYARYKRMNNFNVLFPIGFDSFGLPAENAAIKRGLNPKEWTESNMEHMRQQFRSMGTMFDWSREIQTSNPTYYKWTQWIFTKLFEKELAYRAVGVVNWCPSCNTVLANEQVIDGACERCGSVIEKKEMEEWKLRITAYAERLLDDLKNLNWPEEIKNQQRNWIGRSEGASFSFNLSFAKNSLSKNIEVFTTRPDTLYGVTYLVLAPEHPLIEECKKEIENLSEVEAYKKKTSQKSDVERQSNADKTGVEIKGMKAIHPVTGERLPVWIADYVLSSYGTGAVMAVPAHDERDYDFSKKYSLRSIQVIAPEVIDQNNPPQESKKTTARKMVHSIVYDERGENIISLKWKTQPWRTLIVGGIEKDENVTEGALREIKEETGYVNLEFIDEMPLTVVSRYFAAHKDENRLSETHVLRFKLKDSTQKKLDPKEEAKHEIVWILKEEIKNLNPVAELDYILDWLAGKMSVYTDKNGVLLDSDTFSGMSSEKAREEITHTYGKSKIQYKLRDWSVGRQRYWGTPIPIVYDPEGLPHPIPEEHLPWVLPEDVDFTPTGVAPLGRSKELSERVENIFGKGWTPEVATMDTFVDSSWYFLRYIDPHNTTTLSSKEAQRQWMPVSQYFGGAEHTTLHLLFSRFFQKALFDCGITTEKEPFEHRLNRGLILGLDGNKMSKSKGNVIDPDEIVERVGADTTRLYLAFIGPYNESGSFPWDMGGIAGMRRFLERIWRLQIKLVSEELSEEDEQLIHRTIKKVTEDIEAFKSNTAISAMMKALNVFEKKEHINKKHFEIIIRLLAPFAPHIAEELWHITEHNTSVHLEKWPSFDPQKIISTEYTIIIQVNGKVRGSFKVHTDSTEEEIITLAIDNKDIEKWIEGKKIKKTIYILHKLVNIVI